MNRSVSICLLFLLHTVIHAQEPPLSTQQQLESATATGNDQQVEDDAFLQQLQQFVLDPINLNTAGETELEELLLLSPVQVKNLLAYRKMLGNLVSIYELQAVPGWDIGTIEKIRPFISVSMNAGLAGPITKRLRGGKHSVLLRVSQVLERSNGYKLDSSVATNFYPGSPQKIFFRYKYQYKNLLQYGVLGEKDAGEQFFRGAQKQGFDFYSAHFFARNIGIIRSLALGDFTVNLGQGLIQWQSLAFRKGSDVINIKRQKAVLGPYNSAGEANFHRGIGVTLARKNMEATVFSSYRKLDANFVEDTLNGNAFISSFQASGYHRTKSETADKGIQRQFVLGANIAFNKDKLHIGLNAIHYSFSLPVSKTADPYNLFSLSGKVLGNYSLDYGYTCRNVHFFGEVAFTGNFDRAFLNGLLVSLDPTVDLGLLYRNISKSYQSLYSNAFTETPSPNNEKGFYAGISIRPATAWRIDGYMDLYSFPWLKYQLNAPVSGIDYLVQLTYKPNKQLEIHTRYRTESKPGNDNVLQLALSPVIVTSRQNLRVQLNYKITPTFTFRCRNELVWYNKRTGTPGSGFLSLTDIIYKPPMKKYSGNCRLQYFETDGYDSRLYAFENDILYSFSIPVFYDKGTRYYININYKVSRKLSCWLKWAQTVYKGKSFIGSGLDQFNGNTHSEIKLQLQYVF